MPCDSSLRLAKSECNAYELFWFFLMWNFICMISTDVIPVQLVLFKFPEPLPDVSYLNVFKGNKHHYSNHRTSCCLLCYSSTFHANGKYFQDKRKSRNGRFREHTNRLKLYLSFGKPKQSSQKFYHSIQGRHRNAGVCE